MGIRIENLREQAEQINESQAEAEESLARMRSEQEQAAANLSAVQASVRNAQTTEDRLHAMREEAMARAGLAAAERDVLQAEATLRDVLAKRLAAQQETRRYLDSAQEACGRIDAAKRAGSYGSGALGDARNGLMMDLIQGQQVMEQLGGTWRGGMLGVLPNGPGRDISLSTFEGAALMQGYIDWDNTDDPQKVYTLGSVRHQVGNDDYVPNRDDSGAYAGAPEVGSMALSGAQSLSSFSAASDHNEIIEEAESPDIPPSDGGMNVNAHEDIMSTWGHVKKIYTPDSTEYQETAWRCIEHLEARRAILEERQAECVVARENAERVISRLIVERDESDCDQTSLQRLQEFQELRWQAKETAQRISDELVALEGDLTSLYGVAEQDHRTTFISFSGEDFTHSYDGLITERQDLALKGFSGNCGINTECNQVNQQRGYRIGPVEGIKVALGHKDDAGNPAPLCLYKCDPDDPERFSAINGGTTWADRKEFLASYGLQAERLVRPTVMLPFNTPKGMSPEDIHWRMQEGTSVSLRLKGEDLAQEGLSQRLIWTVNEGGCLRNPTRANHCVNVVGVSFDIRGRVSCLWINDTGNWGGSNRIPISRGKYERMLRHTKGFSIELARWERNSGH